MRTFVAAALAGVLLAGAALPAAAQYRDRGGDDRLSSVAAERADWRRADVALNRAYERAIADARRSDRADRRGANWYSREAALRAAQRAWIPLRDADCRYEVQHLRRDREAANYQCLTEQTEARTGYLRDALDERPQRYSAR